MARWVLKSGLVLLHADDVPAIRDIVIDGSKIIAVGERLAQESGGIEGVVEASGKFVCPGYVNAHYHSHDRWDRGRFSPLPLEIWMGLYNPPHVSRRWTVDEIYLRTLIGGIELIRGGTTTVVDDVHVGAQLDEKSIDAVFRAYADLGIRADVAIAYSDIPSHKTIPFLDELLPVELKSKGQAAIVTQSDMISIWRELNSRWNDRVRSVISISGPQRCTEPFLQAASGLAESLNVPLLAHVLETRVQALSGQLFYGKSLVEHMHELEVLNRLSVLIHGVWMTARDLDLVSMAGSGVVHNPTSNLKLGSGIAPVIEMLNRDIPVALGTDNHNGNDGCSMFESVKFMPMLQTLCDMNFRKWLSARDAVRAGTSGGAKAIGKESEIGRLEVGYKADMLLFDLKDDAFNPLNDPLAHLVFANSGAALCDVYVNGDPVVKDREIVKVDEGAVRREIDSRLKAIQRKINDGVPAGKSLEPYLVSAYDCCCQHELMRPFQNRFNCYG